MAKTRYGVSKFSVNGSTDQVTCTIVDTKSEIELQYRFPLSGDEVIKGEINKLATLLAKKAEKDLGG